MRDELLHVGKRLGELAKCSPHVQVAAVNPHRPPQDTHVLPFAGAQKAFDDDAKTRPAAPHIRLSEP